MWKIATAISTLGLSLSLTAGAGFAQTKGDHTKNFRPHERGGAATYSNGRGDSHLGFVHHGTPHLGAFQGHGPRMVQAGRASHHERFGPRAAFSGSLRPLAGHRHGEAGAAFAFKGGWSPERHVGWLGHFYWPYAYGDFFYYVLWPNQNVNPFWGYGYGDLYEGIFSPYSYDDYVQGPRANSRMAELTQNLAKRCADEAADVAAWPIATVSGVVKPTKGQSTLLGALGNAVIKAGDAVKSHCAIPGSFTPTGRLAAMQQRLQALVQAVATVSTPLTKFYNSLSRAQKIRFDSLGAPPGSAAASNPTSPQAACSAAVKPWPTDQINSAVQPTAAQQPELAALQSAATQTAASIQATCPSANASTVPARLAAVSKRLQAMLQAVKKVAPALAAFYNALSDDQKAHFDALGQQIFAAQQ
jgi:hypothetical protein